MSRSYKKAYAYCGCCHSQKDWRRDYNRRFRRAENANLRNDHDYLCYRVPYRHACADPWRGPTDGRAFYNRPEDWKYSTDEEKMRWFCTFKRHGNFLFHK